MGVIHTLPLTQNGAPRERRRLRERERENKNDSRTKGQNALIVERREKTAAKGEKKAAKENYNVADGGFGVV